MLRGYKLIACVEVHFHHIPILDIILNVLWILRSSLKFLKMGISLFLTEFLSLPPSFCER